MKSLFFLLSILLISCSSTTMEEKFEWLPSESAPSLYPMNIYKGHLFFEDGNSVYIPCSLAAHNGWGNDGSTHVVGEDLKPVPVRLEVTWASFKENKFYTGSWELPKDKMTKLFKEGVTNYRNKKKETYSQIIVGLAPGGVVVVWMYGSGNQIEIGRYQAKETNVAMKDFVPENPTATREEFFKSMGKLEPEQEEEFKKKGITYGIWDTYRKKYNWKADIEVPNHKFESLYVEMFNGESEDIFDEKLVKNSFRERAIPKSITFILKNLKGERTVFSFDLNEEEIFSLFNKVEEKKPIEIVLRMNEDFGNRSLIFKQENNEFPIKKIDIGNMWKYQD